MINNYNPEWIKAWNANMDMQICLDYYAVITYITDYYMKDESGTIEHIRKALESEGNDSLREKMQIVKNTFLTNRQAGECEIYYKLFPFLHLTQSNISTVFDPTGFRQNRAKFMKQITENVRQDFDEVIEGKYYIEKESILETQDELQKLVPYHMHSLFKDMNLADLDQKTMT